MAIDAKRADQLDAISALAATDIMRVKQGSAEDRRATLASLAAFVLSQLSGDRPVCRAASTANLTLSGTQTVDSVALIAGDRILVKNQTLPAENGVYVVAAGAWTRATDMDSWAEVPGAIVTVTEGTANADTVWNCTSDTGGTLGTTPITFAKLFGTNLYQPYNARLANLAVLAGLAGQSPYYTGQNTFGRASFPRVLGHSAVPAAVTGSTTETTLATIAVPANTLGPNGFLRILTSWGYTDSANAKTMRVGFGGTNFLAASATTTGVFQALSVISNRGATNSQYGGPLSNGGFQAATAVNEITAAVDTTVAQNIVITGQLALGTETLTLARYSIEAVYLP